MLFGLIPSDFLSYHAPRCSFGYSCTSLFPAPSTQGLAGVFFQGPDSNGFRLAGHAVCVAAPHLCCGSLHPGFDTAGAVLPGPLSVLPPLPRVLLLGMEHFATSARLTAPAGLFCTAGGRPVHCGVVSSLPGLCPLQTNRAPPSVVTTKTSPDIAKCPRVKASVIENQSHDVT